MNNNDINKKILISLIKIFLMLITHIYEQYSKSNILFIYVNNYAVL